MERVTAVEFENESRVHIALEVSDVARSTAFYRVLLGVDPSKERVGYAKFEPRTPSVNLSLNQGIGRPAGGAQHFGVQVKSTAALHELAQRLRAAGLDLREEVQTSCCYAVQDKVWVDDPDGNQWEVFIVTAADAERRASENTECCVPRAESPAPSSCAGGVRA